LRSVESAGTAALSAVDLKTSAGKNGAAFRRQKCDGRCHFLRVSDPAHGYFPGIPGFDFLNCNVEILRIGLKLRCINDAGLNNTDVDVIRLEFFGQRFSQGRQTGL